MNKLITLSLTSLMATSALVAQPKHDLVAVQSLIPTIQLDIRYATTENVFGTKLYEQPVCYLRRGTAEKLANVQAELNELGFGLKIFDGYFPVSIHKKMIARTTDTRYIPDADIDCPHSRGCALDVTLVRLDGEPVVMPTEFDDPSEKANRTFMDLAPDIIVARNLLEHTLIKHGFLADHDKWWHFDDADWQEYDILDIAFKELG